MKTILYFLLGILMGVGLVIGFDKYGLVILGVGTLALIIYIAFQLKKENN